MNHLCPKNELIEARLETTHQFTFRGKTIFNPLSMRWRVTYSSTIIVFPSALFPTYIVILRYH